jgi:hypothetical protein
MGIGTDSLNDRLPNALAVAHAIEAQRSGFSGKGATGREGIFDPDESGHTLLQDLPALVDAAQTFVALLAHVYKHFARTPSTVPGFNPPRGAAPISIEDGHEVLRMIGVGVTQGAFSADPVVGPGESVDPRDIPFEDAQRTHRRVQGGPIDPNAVHEVSGTYMGPAGRMGPSGADPRGIDVPGGPSGPLQYLTIGMYIAEKVLPQILTLIQRIKNR